MQTASDHQSSFQKLLEYEQRSLSASEEGPSEQERASNWSGVVFRVSDYKLTCGINEIQEILTLPPMTPVPGSKSWILGLANVRGNLVTVCDLYWYLTGVRSPITMRTRLLVVDLKQRPVGLLVDEVYGQRHFHTDEQAETERFEATEFTTFVKTEYASQQNRWGVLELSSLVSEATFLSGASQ